MTTVRRAAPVEDARRLLRKDEGGVATLTLNRPAQFNALSQALLGELETRSTRSRATPAVRVVVLAGAGKAFCAGHDLEGDARERGSARSPATSSSAPGA